MDPQPHAGYFIIIRGELIAAHTKYCYAGHLELWKEWFRDNVGVTVRLSEAPSFTDCPSGRVDKALIDGVEKWVVGVPPDFPPEWRDRILDEFQLFALPKRELHWEEDPRFLGLAQTLDDDYDPYQGPPQVARKAE